MRKMILICLPALALLFSAHSFANNDPNIAAIKARQGEMQLRNFNTEALFAMAKGDMEYDAEKAASFANNLKLLLEFNIGHAWIPGTDSEKYPGETRALPDNWTNYPEAAKISKQYAEAVNAVAAVAGDGLGEIRRTVGALGESCKACHDNFRAKR